MKDAIELTELAQDASRFVMYHKGVIESYYLQTYASALLFSPIGRIIRRLFQHEKPKGTTVKPAMSGGWSACLWTRPVCRFIQDLRILCFKSSKVATTQLPGR